jgi:TP901 family phage tail tape measure protein
MPSLASLFVTLDADDRKATVKVSGLQRKLVEIDRTKVAPKVTLPDMGPQIRGLQTRLQALGKTSVKLHVDQATIGAEVSSIKRQLFALQKQKLAIPLHLQDKINAEIAEVQRELAVAERKQHQIPLKLERVDAKIAAVQKSLGRLDAPVPVNLDPKHTLREQLAAVRGQVARGVAGGAELDAAGTTAGKRFGSSFSAGFRSLGAQVVAGSVLLELVRGLTSAVGSAGKFDQTMRLVGVTTGESSDKIAELTRLAVQMGKETSFSAQGAGDAMVALAKGGLTQAEIKSGALKQTLTLATAGGIDLGDSANYMVQGLKGFGLEAGRSTEVAAALAGAANASTADISDMGLALAQVGPGARSAGLSIQDTTAALAAFANAGIKGSDAGTSLKTFLNTLTPSTTKARKEMQALGLITEDGANQFFDASGKVKSLAEISGVLQNALKGQTREQTIATSKIIFGTDAYRAATILATEGAKGIGAYTRATNDQSQAQALADNATAGYAGALERFKGTVETLGITLGTKLLPPLTSLFNFLGDRVVPAFESFGQAAGPLIGVLEKVGGVLSGTIFSSATSSTTAISALIAVMAARGVSSFANSISLAAGRLQDLGGNALTAGTRIANVSVGVGKVASFLGGPWGIAIGLAVTAIVGFATKQKAAADAAKEFTSSLEFQNGKLTDNARATIANKLAKDGAYDAALKAGVSERDLTNALINGGEARSSMVTQLDNIAKAHTHTIDTGHGLSTVVDATGKAARTARDQIVAMGSGLDAAAHSSTQAGNALSTTNTYTDRQKELADKLAKADQGLTAVETGLNQQLEREIRNFTILKGGALDQETANNSWEDSIANVRKSLKSNGATLDVHTAKGRANREMVVSAIKALNDKISADFKANVQSKGLARATDIASEALRKGRARLDSSAKGAKLTKDEMKRMQDRMLLTPSKLTTSVDVPGAKSSQDKIAAFKREIDRINSQKWNANLQFHTNAKGVVTDLNKTFRLVKGGPRMTLSAGGPVQNLSGHGVKGKDTEIAAVGVGEHMLDAGDVDNMGGHRNVFKLRELAKTGQIKDVLNGYAGGGPINHGQGNRGHGVSRTLTANVQTTGVTSRQMAAIGVNPNYKAAGGRGSGNYPQMMAFYIGRQLKKLVTAVQKAKDSGGGPIGGKGFANALKWARSQAGKPYIWAGVGPRGYDCSGFMGAIQNVILGRNPYQRRWSTHSFSGQAHAAGFTKNKVSPFRIGVTNAGVGHTAGTLNGVNVESSGGRGVHLGKGARGWNNGLFPMHYGLAEGGPILSRIPGEPAFDLLDPRGNRYNPKLKDIFEQMYGAVPMADGAIVRGGRGGVLAHVGEGRRDELVTPLPQGWEAPKRDATAVAVDRLVQAIETYGLTGPQLSFGDVVVEHGSEAQGVNRRLQRGLLGLV